MGVWRPFKPTQRVGSRRFSENVFGFGSEPTEGQHPFRTSRIPGASSIPPVGRTYFVVVTWDWAVVCWLSEYQQISGVSLMATGCVGQTLLETAAQHMCMENTSCTSQHGAQEKPPRLSKKAPEPQAFYTENTARRSGNQAKTPQPQNNH